jgi:integrase
MTASLPSQSPALPGPQEIFERWADAEVARWLESRGRSGFSPDTVPVYRSIWTVWLQWLAGRSASEFRNAHWRWLRVRQVHVQAFVDGPAPAATRRQPKDRTRLASFTRQRYWAVLRDVYAHAVSEGLLQSNPALELEPTPSIARRARVPQVLPVRVLALLRDPDMLAKLLPEAKGWWVHRDRAAVALLAHCGMTSGELIAVRGRDLRRGAHYLQPPGQSALEGLADPATLQIDVGERSVPVPEELLPLLQTWLEVRHELLLQQRTRAQLLAREISIALDERALRREPEQPLLLSREAPAGSHTSLASCSLFVVVRRCLRAAYSAAEVEGLLDSKQYVAAGPAIIRNTVIRTWAEDPSIGPGQAAEWAGLKTVERLQPDSTARALHA